MAHVRERGRRVLDRVSLVTCLAVVAVVFWWLLFGRFWVDERGGWGR